MNAKGVEQILEVLIRETGIILSRPREEVSAEAPLAELGYDSMSFIELLLSVEREFGVKLIEAEMRPEDMETLERLARRIHQAG